MMELLPLHNNENLMNDCMEILNKEWPRSKGARLHSFRSSCDQLPVFLAFARKSESKIGWTVLGCSKISAVQGKQNSCLFESIIIRDEDRGKGLGRQLMEMTEEYAQRLGMKTVYLSTRDKLGFYSCLGYVQCNPVVSLGANAHRVPEAMLKRFMQNTDQEADHLCNRMEKLGTGKSSLPHPSLISNGDHKQSVSCPRQDTITMPPTSTAHSPPPQSVGGSCSIPPLTQSSCSQQLSKPPGPPPSGPHGPPPPQPPVPPPPPASQKPAITRVDQNPITWMKKQL